MERHISVDNIESITIFKRFDVPYEDVVKVHSKGDVKKFLWFFKKKYEEDIYEPSFNLGGMEITRSELKEKFLDSEHLELDVNGNIYYKPHVKIKYYDNNKSYVKYFKTYDELKEFSELLNTILVKHNKYFIPF